MAALLLFGALPASASTIELLPGSSFEAAVEALQPGDTLVVHAGTYADTGRISITVRGTATAPVVIRGADDEARPHITRPAGATAQNTINIEGATHLTIRGLEISSNGGDGVNLSGNPSHITLGELEIHDIDVGINFRSSMQQITVRGNHIHRTGQDGGTGEGMYVGCNYATCSVSDSLIEGNWIHDTMESTQGDGIEIKRGSHSIVVRDNVIHDTRYPCILLYGTEGNPRNLVEGNALWNCGDSGIQAAADAVIRNNLILHSLEVGFNSQSHQGVTPNNLEFVNNTLVGGAPCLRLSSWADKQGMIFANNAVYCESGSFVIGGLSGVDVRGNVVYPATGSLPASGYTTGLPPGEDLLDPEALDVWPTEGSTLIGAASAERAPAVDFNANARSAPHDAGAYARNSASNSGWTVSPGFKAGSTPPDDPAAPQPPTGLQVD